jgi:hypothetical protein
MMFNFAKKKYNFLDEMEGIVANDIQQSDRNASIIRQIVAHCHDFDEAILI